MTVAGFIRQQRYQHELRSRLAGYAQEIHREKRLGQQLRLWNVQWRQISRQIPYWKELCVRRGLPSEFKSWDEFREQVPVMTRADVRSHGVAMSNSSRPADFHRKTGGTTAQPVQMPAWNDENRVTLPDVWVARDWYGVRPAARVFMIWGHSHLLGTGVKGWISARVREIKDGLLGYYRFSAYDLGIEALKHAASEIIKFQPDVVYGYSVALDLLARANRDLRDRLRNLGVKVVIGAAEGFPSAGSESLLADMFGCPVAMEYGSVETHLMAHSHPRGGYGVFWHNYLLEVETAAGSRQGRVRVTSLYPRCFPLVRYELGDEIELPDDDATSFGISRFKRVVGRCNDYVLLDGDVRIHSEAFTHVVRGISVVDGYQVVQTGSDLKLLLLTRAARSAEIEQEIRSGLAKIHPLLDRVQIQRVSALRQTVAGKTPMVMRAQ